MLLEIYLVPKRSDLFQSTLMFKQQSMKVLQYAQGETVPEKQKNTPPTHPTPIFNSKERCGSSLFNFLKQNNKIFTSTISKLPNNAFYSIIL